MDTATLEMLRELTNKAAQGAGLALSELLREKTVLRSTFADIVPVSEIHRNIFLKVEKVGIMIFARLGPELRAELILAIEEKNAYHLINLANVSKPVGDLGALTEMGVSVLKETGNIIIGTYLTQLSKELKIRIDPPLSIFLSGVLDKIFYDLIYYPQVPVQLSQRYLIQTDFEVPHEGILGNISIAFTAEAAQKISALVANPKI